ncbi:DUF992 domain-containing protein [Pararhizobium haloflavum]|uniref:DUF992 domain-containing protein n=1 Tax=Pararhizobium haloflavum TaxID=2037914 RepID=UPI000C18547D|nr:DUF992 domain-containing protein [Pararhizobium haloflavum]
MKKLVATVTFLSATLGAAALAQAADMGAPAPAPQAPMVYQETGPRDGVRIGFLDCSVGSGLGYVIGSAKSVDCVFRSAMGSEPLDAYSGTIRKLGVDLGYTSNQRLVWAVFAPTAGYHEGSLGGLYEGISAEATVGAGVGANVLVGGTSGSVHLQTVSVTGQLGLNLAAAGTSMTLNPVNQAASAY